MQDIIISEFIDTDLYSKNLREFFEKNIPHPEHAALAKTILGDEYEQFLDITDLPVCESFLTYMTMIGEEVPAMNSGGGQAIDNTVVKIKVPKVSQFAGARVYHVDSETYHRSIKGKARKERFSKYIKDDDILTDVRGYATKNPHASILLQCTSSGAHTVLKYGRKHPLGR